MTDLAAITNEQMPTSPARLPALAAPELSVAYLAQMKEILESLLGRRNSPWDRAVTFRDLQAGGLGAFLPGGAAATASPAIFNPGTGQVTTSGGATFDIDAALRESSAYKTLLLRIGSVEELADMPEQVRMQLEQAITALARERQADVHTVESMVQHQQVSVAWRLDEITASLNQAAAGARQYNAAYADQVRAVATRVEQVAAELAAGGGGVEVQEQIQAISDAVEGLKGQWSLKIQTNPTNGQPPIIAGISLSVEDPIAGPGTSSLIFLAEEFGFFTEGGSLNPFSIVGNDIVMNGNVRIDGTLDFNGLTLAINAAGTTAEWINVTGPNRPADNATVGAPANTYVGGTLAQTVEANAAAGAGIANRPAFSVNQIEPQYYTVGRVSSANVGTYSATFANPEGAVGGTWSIATGGTGGVAIDGPSNLATVALKTVAPYPLGEQDYYVTFTASDAGNRSDSMTFVLTVDFT